MTLTLESGQLITIQESDKQGYFQLKIDDVVAPLNRKESEIVTNTFDNFLG